MSSNHSHPTAIGIVVTIGLLLQGCGGPPAAEPDAVTEDTEVAVDWDARAVEIAHDAVIVDTHVDLPYRLQGVLEDLTLPTEGHFDEPRARAGGLDAPFMSIYVPSAHQETGDGATVADELIDLVESIVAEWPDRFRLAVSPADIRSAHDEGLIALPMGMENGAPLTELGDLQHFFARGVRYVTLTHSENNAICDSSYADDATWNGLSPWGRELVAEMNRIGMMIDISHVSDETAIQVLELTRAPVIASHSSCRHFTPGFERNMPDDLIRSLAAKGGVIQINFGSAFLTEAAQKQSFEAWDVMEAFIEEQGLDWSSPEVEAKEEDYWAEHERVPTRLEDVADHIDHVVELVGVDHVGFGSDFDGVTALPTGLEDVSRYPALIAELLRRGYSEDDARKIMGENLLRVWEEVEKVAAALGAESAS